MLHSCNVALLAIAMWRAEPHTVALNYKLSTMATNPPKGDGHRNGAVRDRSQVYNPKVDRFVKRDTDSGRFMDQKVGGEPFKGVRKEK